MAGNVRMKIAVGATVLGLGGLASYALGSNDGQPASADAPTAQDPRVRTEVVHRTIHVRAKGRSEDVAGADGSSDPGAAEALVNDLPSSYENDEGDEYESQGDEYESQGGGYESEDAESESEDDDGDEPDEHESEGEDADD